MLTAACWLYASMIGCWLVAACTYGPALWLRWVLVAVTLPVVVAAWAAAPRRVRPAALLLPLGLLVAYGLVLGVTSAAPGLAVFKCAAFAGTTFTCLLGAPLLVERFGRDQTLAAWRFLWRGLLALSILATASGVWRGTAEGLYGPTDNPNMFGSLLVTFGAILFLAPTHGKRRGPLFAVEVSVLVGLLFATRCRTALLGFGVASVVCILAERGARRWIWTSAITAAAILVLLMMPTPTLNEVERVVRKATPDSVSGEMPGLLDTRVAVWQESFKAMLGALPFGLGWGVKANPAKTWTMDIQSLGYGREEGTSWLPVGEELGLPGLVLVGWLWVSSFRGARRQPHRIRLLALGSLTTLFVLTFFEGWFLSPGNWESMAFWSSLGILLARSARAPASRPELLVVGPLAPMSAS